MPDLQPDCNSNKQPETPPKQTNRAASCRARERPPPSQQQMHRGPLLAPLAVNCILALLVVVCYAVLTSGALLTTSTPNNNFIAPRRCVPIRLGSVYIQDGLIDTSTAA